MQNALIIIDNLGNVVWKAVYAGNLSFRDSEALRLAAKYPTCSITKFDSDQDSAFVSATVSNPQNIAIE